MEKYFQLMCKDVIVAEMKGGWQVYRPELLPHNLDFNTTEVPSYFVELQHSLLVPKEDVTINRYRQSQFITWLSRRILSLDRANAKKILNALKLSQNQSPDEKAKIALTHRAVSVCDSWWVKFGDSDNAEWEKINLFNNTLNNTIALIGLSGGSMTLQAKHGLTAELSTRGSYAKGWFKEGKDGNLYLYKAEDNRLKESQREVCASKVIDCFNVYANLKYELVKKYNPMVDENSTCSKCLLMSNPDMAVVHAAEFDVYLRRQGSDVIRYAQKHYRKEFSQMVVIDYLISNSDRHSENWGFLRSMIDGSVQGMHPLYDHNNAFDPALLRTDDTESILIQDRTMKQAASVHMHTAELQLIKKPTEKMFPNEPAYEVFKRRCKELGLWDVQEKTASGKPDRF